MSTVIVEDHGPLGLIRLDNGVTNAIGPGLLADLESAIDDVVGRHRGLVLSGGEKFFSIGLDLPQLLEMDRDVFADFWFKFNRFFMNLYTMSIPSACALTGHAVAGGAVLSLTTDFRIAADGKTKIGLNEIKLGVPVPWATYLTLRQLVGDRAASRVIYLGDFLTTTEATEMGWVDEVTSPERVEARALEWLEPMATSPAGAFAADKEYRTERVVERYEAQREQKDAQFLEAWFSNEVQDILRKTAATF